MTEPFLVVDFGAHDTSAAIADGDAMTLVTCPMTGAARWPSAVCLDQDNLLIGNAAQHRRDVMPRWYASGLRAALDAGVTVPLGEGRATASELLSRYLSVVRAEADRRHPAASRRLVLTVPSSYAPHDPRRATMLAIAEECGIPGAELVTDAAAALRDPLLGLPGGGDLVWVCDLGASWKVSLHRLEGDRSVQLAQETSGSAQDIDLMLLDDLRVMLGDWVEHGLSAPGDEGLRARAAALDFVRRVKHRLATADEAADWLVAGTPAYRLTRPALDRLAEPAVRWLLASCRATLARTGFALNDVAGIVLVGGSAHLPGIAATLGSQLLRPVWTPPDPELSVVRGAAAWAAGRPARALGANPPAWRMEPLAWRLPAGRARLVRWLVAPGESYPPGAVLAQVRTDDDEVFDLTTERDGILAEQRVQPGSLLDSDVIAGLSRSTRVIAGDRPAKRLQLRVDGQWLLTPDHRTLVECAESGAYVRIRSITTGAVTAELRPLYPGPDPVRGRVFFAPDGRVVLVSWAPDGHFFVWDVETGILQTQFRAGSAPLSVLVNEAMWRIVAQLDKVVHVGRYRRDVATMWDLTTGTVVEDIVGEDLHKRFAGYADRSRADGFAAETRSPNGRLLAAAHTDTGAISLREAETGQELFREALGGGKAVRTAFSADGTLLLACSRSGEGSSIDIWRV